MFRAKLLGLTFLVAGCNGRVQSGAEADGGKPGVDGSPTGDAQSLGAIVVASGLNVSNGAIIASDNANLFVQDSDHRIVSIPVAGGSITTVVPSGATGGFLAVDASNVYYLGDDGLYGVAKTGGATLNISHEKALAAAILDGRTYWASGSAPDFALKAATTTGGSPQVVASLGIQVSQIAVTKDAVFANPGGQPVETVPASGVPEGGTPLKVSAGQICDDLFSDRLDAYCTAGGGGGAITKVSIDGSVQAITSVRTGGSGAVDATKIYYVDLDIVTNEIVIWSVPKHGGAPTVFARDHTSMITVDDNAVYWISTGGRVMRQLK